MMRRRHRNQEYCFFAFFPFNTHPWPNHTTQPATSISHHDATIVSDIEAVTLSNMHATMRNVGPHTAGVGHVKKIRGASEVDQWVVAPHDQVQAFKLISTYREARSSAEIMRSDLKTQPPWSRDVEQQRQKCVIPLSAPII
jgi:hypothetical protein